MNVLIAIPCMESVPTDFMTSLLNLRKPEGTHYAVSKNSLIYDSRNAFAANAITSAESEDAAVKYDRILWLDSDMVFDPDLLMNLNDDMDMGLDYVSGLCFTRKMPTYPVVYSDIIYDTSDGRVRADAVKMPDYPRDSLFQCAGTGFGAVMTSVKLLKDVWEHYGPPFDPMTHMGEDLSFCWRARQLGHDLYCDSRIKVGHEGYTIFDENTYIAQQNTQNGR